MSAAPDSTLDTLTQPKSGATEVAIIPVPSLLTDTKAPTSKPQRPAIDGDMPILITTSSSTSTQSPADVSVLTSLLGQSPSVATVESNRGADDSTSTQMVSVSGSMSNSAVDGLDRDQALSSPRTGRIATAPQNDDIDQYSHYAVAHDGPGGKSKTTIVTAEALEDALEAHAEKKQDEAVAALELEQEQEQEQKDRAYAGVAVAVVPPPDEQEGTAVPEGTLRRNRSFPSSGLEPDENVIMMSSTSPLLTNSSLNAMSKFLRPTAETTPPNDSARGMGDQRNSHTVSKSGSPSNDPMQRTLSIVTDPPSRPDSGGSADIDMQSLPPVSLTVKKLLVSATAPAQPEDVHVGPPEPIVPSGLGVGNLKGFYEKIQASATTGRVYAPIASVTVRDDDDCDSVEEAELYDNDPSSLRSSLLQSSNGVSPSDISVNFDASSSSVTGLNMTVDRTEAVVEEDLVVPDLGLLDSLFTNSTDAMLVVSIHGTLLKHNNAALVFIYADNAVGTHLSNVIHCDLASELLSVLRHNKDHQSGKVKSLHVKQEDGHELPIEVSCSRVTDTQLLLIMRDCTTQEALVRRLRRRTAEMNKSNCLLNQVSKVKDDFLANTSHELRTPLHAILGITASMMEASDKGGIKLSESQLSDLEVIGSNAHRLLHIVTEILDFSKMNSPDNNLALQMTSVDIGKAISLSVRICSYLIAHKPLVLKADLPETGLPLVQADDFRLQQILINLIVNAIKFTREGSVIVSARVVPGSPDTVCVRVSDTGVGIPSDQLDAVFEPFTQARSSDSLRRNGVGLGLAIAQKLTRLHGSELRVKSELGRGSTFEFSLQKHDGSVPAATPSAMLDMIDAVSHAGFLEEPMSISHSSLARTQSVYRSNSPPNVNVHRVTSGGSNDLLSSGSMSIVNASTSRAPAGLNVPPAKAPLKRLSKPSALQLTSPATAHLTGDADLPLSPGFRISLGKSSSFRHRLRSPDVQSRPPLPLKASTAASSRTPEPVSSTKRLSHVPVEPRVDTAEMNSEVNLPMVAAPQSRKSVSNLAKVDPSLGGSVQQEPIHVLCIDDNAVNLDILKRILVLNNFKATIMLSGKDALKVLIAEDGDPTPHHYDLVLLDVMMPEISGFEVCAKLRDVYTANELPIVLLTARDQVSDIVKAFEMGANDYLVKPFNAYELVARIHSHIALSKLHKSYSRFVPSEFLGLLGKDKIEDVSLGDQSSLDMSVLFCDIRSFSAISELLTPQEVFQLLSNLMLKIAPCCRLHGGFIDKYIGDAVMALFPTSPDDALEAAEDIIVALERFNDNHDTDPIQKKIDKIKMGVGVHSGRTIVGTLGEHSRMETTVISDTVNVASRLEGLTKAFGTAVLTSEDTMQRLAFDSQKQDYMRWVGKVSVKGRSEGTVLHEYFATDNKNVQDFKRMHKEEFYKGLQYFEKDDIPKAKAQFDALHKLMKEAKVVDGPLIFYMDVCTVHLQLPLSKRTRASITGGLKLEKDGSVSALNL